MQCAPGDLGEICVRGPNVMRGICGRTRDDDVLAADGFYRHRRPRRRSMPTATSGISGRRDDMFKVKGATVFPREVEAALRSIDGVRQAFVTDVSATARDRRQSARSSCRRCVARRPGRGRPARWLSAFKVPTLWLLADVERAYR